jgi:hypothetical protein
MKPRGLADGGGCGNREGRSEWPLLRRLERTLGAAYRPLRKHLEDKALLLPLRISYILFLYFMLDSVINYSVLRH